MLLFGAQIAKISNRRKYPLYNMSIKTSFAKFDVEAQNNLVSIMFTSSKRDTHTQTDGLTKPQHRY